MALLSSVESAPRAYRLKASNAASPISTSIGTMPMTYGGGDFISYPWETIIKSFRAENGNNVFSTVVECSAKFLGYLKLGFSHSRCVSKCIFHALPDMARNFYAVSAWPRHERNLVM